MTLHENGDRWGEVQQVPNSGGCQDAIDVSPNKTSVVDASKSVMLKGQHVHNNKHLDNPAHCPRPGRHRRSVQ